MTALLEQQDATIRPKPNATANAPLGDLPLYIPHRLSQHHFTAAMSIGCMSLPELLNIFPTGVYIKNTARSFGGAKQSRKANRLPTAALYAR